MIVLATLALCGGILCFICCCCRSSQIARKESPNGKIRLFRKEQLHTDGNEGGNSAIFNPRHPESAALQLKRSFCEDSSPFPHYSFGHNESTHDNIPYQTDSRQFATYLIDHNSNRQIEYPAPPFSVYQPNVPDQLSANQVGKSFPSEQLTRKCTSIRENSLPIPIIEELKMPLFHESSQLVERSVFDAADVRVTQPQSKVQSNELRLHTPVMNEKIGPIVSNSKRPPLGRGFFGFWDKRGRFHQGFRNEEGEISGGAFDDEGRFHFGVYGTVEPVIVEDDMMAVTDDEFDPKTRLDTLKGPTLSSLSRRKDFKNIRNSTPENVRTSMEAIDCSRGFTSEYRA
jgi:hypothetical protein